MSADLGVPAVPAPSRPPQGGGRSFFVRYLGRELGRRARQATVIALGLALGIGLVITVTAAASGVKNAQGTVLKALYGVGTDATVTKTPTAGSVTPGSFGFGFRAGTAKRPAPGTKINTSTLGGTATLASMSASSVTTVAGLHDVAAAAGGLTLNDRTLSGTMPAINFNGGGGGFNGGGSGFGGAGSGLRLRAQGSPGRRRSGLWPRRDSGSGQPRVRAIPAFWSAAALTPAVLQVP